MDRDLLQDERVLTTNANGRQNTLRSFNSGPPLGKSVSTAATKENRTTSDTESIPLPKRQPARIATHHHHGSDSFIPRRVGSPSPTETSDRSSIVHGTPRHSVNTTRNTRIPRPKTTGPVTSISRRDPGNPRDSPEPSSPMRYPMSMSAAFRRAREQTAAEDLADSDSTTDTAGFNGSPSPAPRSFRRDLPNPGVSKASTGARETDLNKHLQQFDQNHRLAGSVSRSDPVHSLFAKRDAGFKTSEVGQALSRRASGTGVNEPAGSHKQDSPLAKNAINENLKLNATGNATSWPGNREFEAGTADIAVPSIEYEEASDGLDSPGFGPLNRSPEKGINWQLDADFTAGDLQVSESPRVKVAKNMDTATAPSSRRPNGRLSQIQEREIEVAKTNFAEDTLSNKQKLTRLEEIRAREMEASSKDVVASSRLDEIQMRNSEPSSQSPEDRKQQDRKLNNGRSPSTNNERASDFRRAISSSEANHVPALSTSHTNNRLLDRESKASEGLGTNSDRNVDKHDFVHKNDPHDLLRRLTRATSSSPPVEDVEQKKANEEVAHLEQTALHKAPVEHDLNRASALKEETKARNLDVKNTRGRLTVGFADHKRNVSSDSVQEKRSSTHNSDIDPTDRIEAELKLFAPQDNYSEKGSTRAPSPGSSEPVDEKTPRPVKIDPLTQPTPRVTGAYVDTPATVRVQRNDHPNSAPSSKANGDVDSGTGPRASSMPTPSRRRDKSSSRRRRQLVNTAKPPTVKEDLISILRAHNIDDSTLENLGSLLTSQDETDDEFDRTDENVTGMAPSKTEVGLDSTFPNSPDHKRELAAYDRMSKSLETGLLGIRSAKKGIERLEGKVIHADRKDTQAHPKSVQTPPVLASNDITHVSRPHADGVPLLIPVPRLYRKDPHFKLTTFGIFALLFGLWYVLESAFCLFYEGPEYECTPSIPCEWSPNEPYFPYTMPFMLDEWATGGKGRALALRVGEEIGDIVADASDWVTNTDFTQFDQRYMNVWQRKRHLRRLRKHNLVEKWREPEGYQARYPTWLAAKAARESAQELGYDGEDETMSADEIVR
ncbi:hypothetical protein GGR57DRAFT_472708 [Xylariaceae sp. FL1272]|nr:hypothetical protein GGR57DRAFT_472708 [Xylariaceae sp. FL1272]